VTKITPEHLTRGAYIYIRQSTADQLLHNHAGVSIARASDLALLQIGGNPGKTAWGRLKP
jgi:hypothetical protein